MSVLSVPWWYEHHHHPGRTAPNAGRTVNTRELEAKLDHYHDLIHRYPHMRAKIAPFIRRTEDRLLRIYVRTHPDEAE